MQIARGSAPSAHFRCEEASDLSSMGAGIGYLTEGRFLLPEGLVRGESENVHFSEESLGYEDSLVV